MAWRLPHELDEICLPTYIDLRLALIAGPRGFEGALAKYLADTGAGPTPHEADDELAAEILHLLGVNLDFRGSVRGAQVGGSE